MHREQALINSRIKLKDQSIDIFKGRARVPHRQPKPRMRSQTPQRIDLSLKNLNIDINLKSIRTRDLPHSTDFDEDISINNTFRYKSSRPASLRRMREYFNTGATETSGRSVMSKRGRKNSRRLGTEASGRRGAKKNLGQIFTSAQKNFPAPLHNKAQMSKLKQIDCQKRPLKLGKFDVKDRLIEGFFCACMDPEALNSVSKRAGREGSQTKGVKMKPISLYHRFRKKGFENDSIVARALSTIFPDGIVAYPLNLTKDVEKYYQK